MATKFVTIGKKVSHGCILTEMQGNDYTES